jgi:LuxR family maltose regulon positive regulatory protein
MWPQGREAMWQSDLNLIGTKYRLPPLNAAGVDRRRLHALLARAGASRLTTIAAPAGFGKTTLLLQWARRLQAEAVPVAWLSLDEDDDEVGRFLCYLIAAIQAAQPRLGKGAVSLLRSSPGLPVAPVLANLVNDLARAEGRFVVMLDDVHWLTRPDLLQALESLLTYAPTSVHFILAGRGALPLAAARLKVRGQVTELHEADLRFDLDETQEFLNTQRALALSSADLVVLQHRTEGWAAGLQLASLSLERRVERSAFIDSFSGTDRDIADFLASDVFIRQPRALQDFMLRTAFLRRMNAELAAALTDLSVVEAGDMLKRIERAGLFLVPLDSEERWFRYHHLFSDFLRHQMQRRQPTAIPALHLKAAGWLEVAGETADAIHHLIAADAGEAAADKVEACAMDLIRQSHLIRLNDWLRRLPEALLQRRPRLLLSLVWLQFQFNRPIEAARALRLARRAIARSSPDEAQRLQWQSELRVLMCGVLSASDRSARARALARRWIPDLPEDQPFLSGALENILAYCEYSLGHLTAAREACVAARRSHIRAQSILGIVYSDLILGLTEKAAGDLKEASRLFVRVRGLADEALGSGSYAAALVGVFQGELHYEWNNLDEAARSLDEYRDIVEESALMAHETVAAVLGARLEAAQGRIDAALAALDRGERRHGRRARHTRLGAGLLHERVRLLLSRDDRMGARLAIQNFGIDADTGQLLRPVAPVPSSDLERLALARLWIAEGRSTTAMAALDALAARLAEQGRGRRLLQARLLRSVAGLKAGANETAERALLTSIVEARRQNLLRSFLDESLPAAELIERLRRRCAGRAAADLIGSELEPVRRYLDRLASAFGLQRLGTARMRPDHPALHLSRRELEVVKLLCNGFSNHQLSRHLAISPDTVKWHLKNIFGKLEVDNRAQAIVAAERLGLISIREQ